MSMSLKIYGEEHPDIATSYNNIGGVYASLEMYDKALANYKKALSIKLKIYGEEHPATATSYNNIGGVYDDLGMYDRALENYKKALRIFVLKKTRHEEAVCHCNLGRIYARMQKIDKAIQEMEKGLKIYDQIRLALTSDDLKEKFFNRYRKDYDFLFELYEKRGEHKKAFKVTERAKSVVFMEYLAKKGAQNVLMKMYPETGEYFEKERMIYNRIKQIETLLRKEKDQKKQDQYAQEIDRLYQELQGLYAELKDKYPSLAQLMKPEAIDLQELQKLLEQDEVVVSYFFTGNTGWAFVVARDEFKSIKLPGLNKKAILEEVTELRSLVHKMPLRPTSASLRGRYAKLAYKLYEQLIEPVKPYLSGRKVFISADRSLYSLPLEILISKEKRRSYRKMPYVGNDYAFSYLPTATSMRFLRDKRYMGRREGWEYDFIAFANPEFGTRGRSESRSLMVRALEEQGIEIPELPETEEEVKKIGEIIGGKEKLYLRKEATEAHVELEEVGRARIISFATHGFLGTELTGRGILEPGLVLSQVGNKGEYDGFLTASEVVGLKLRSAELVILSACNTAGRGGKGGEGFAGLSRSFMFAGARSLVVSHWKVASGATKEMMVAIMKAIKKGKSKLEAIKYGRKYVRGLRPEYNLPYFWGAFVLVGEEY